MIVLILMWAAGLGKASLPSQQASSFERFAALAQIYHEVLDFGPRPGENFVKQELFIGGPDDDDTNKNISVIVLIQTIDGAERMTIQVTRMERNRNDPRIKTARETKSIIGYPDRSLFRITRSDFAADELESVCSQILRAIQDKKRLIKGSDLNIQQIRTIN